jgi:hypothetical protein
VAMSVMRRTPIPAISRSYPGPAKLLTRAIVQAVTPAMGPGRGHETMSRIWEAASKRLRATRCSERAVALTAPIRALSAAG